MGRADIGIAMISIENMYFKRSFQTGSGFFCTTQFVAQGEGNSLVVVPTSGEGVVVINGKEYELGGGKGNGCKYLDFEQGLLPDGGRYLMLYFGAIVDLPGVKIRVVFEAPSDVSVLIKRIDVINNGAELVVINGMVVEEIKPCRTDGYQLILENDYVRDGMTIHGERVYSPWIEEQHKYIDALFNTREEVTRFSYPVEMDWALDAGEIFSSFRVFEFVVPRGDVEKMGLSMRKATRELFPWTRDQSLCCKLAPAVSVQDYYSGIDSAAEVGFEAVILHHGWVDGFLTSPLFTNYNDYELRKDLFPGGWDDVRKLTDYAHGKGIKISFYTIYVNTWREAEQPRVLAENDWELIWDKEDDSARWGVTVDPATAWGDVVNAKILDSIKRGGFDAWHLDGPYYGDVCVAEGRAYKPGGPNQVLGWESQKRFYKLMRENGLHGEAAQGFQAFAHGMSKITTSGYNEGDFGTMPMRAQILANRKAAYKFTYLYRSEQATTSIPVVPWSDDENAPSLLPMEDHADEYDSYLANTYGYGFEGQPYFKVAFEGPKSRKAVVRWLDFWKQHRSFFKNGYLVHIKEPDGRGIDAVMHVLEEDGKQSALVVAYNPTQGLLFEELSLPFGCIGWDMSGWKPVDGNCGECYFADGRLSVNVPALNAVWCKLVSEKE